jgi:hypothetical protein
VEIELGVVPAFHLDARNEVLSMFVVRLTAREKLRLVMCKYVMWLPTLNMVILLLS